MSDTAYMILFWCIAAGMALAVVATMLRAVLATRQDETPTETSDLQIYRDQLRDIARDLERGTLHQDEAERLRTEVSRRILAADAQSRVDKTSTDAPRAATGAVAAVMALCVVGGGFVMYSRMGTPGYGDLPRDQRIAAAAALLDARPAQAEVEASRPPRQAPPQGIPDEFRDLIAQLRTAVADRPNDLQGQELLARYEATLGNYGAARKAQEQVIAIKGDDATARDFADLADALVLAAGGYVSPEAQKAIDETLARDPNNGVALYYQGLMLAQSDRPDLAFGQWDALLRASPPNAPWVAPIRAQIQDLAWMAGKPNYRLPQAAAPTRGPSEADMQAAAEMDPQARREMIQGMVDGLSERLATEGGPPEEWAQLISALAVLGRHEQAQAIWSEAQGVFAEAPEALDMLNQAARAAGLSE